VDKTQVFIFKTGVINLDTVNPNAMLVWRSYIFSYNINKISYHVLDTCWKRLPSILRHALPRGKGNSGKPWYKFPTTLFTYSFLIHFFAIKKTPCIKPSCTLMKKREMHFTLCFDTSVTDSKINCVLWLMWCDITYTPRYNWRSVSHVESRSFI